MLLVGLFDLVVVTAADARPLAGCLDIAQLLGQLQQADAGFDKLLCVAHEWCPFGGDLGFWKIPNLSPQGPARSGLGPPAPVGLRPPFAYVPKPLFPINVSAHRPLTSGVISSRTWASGKGFCYSLVR